MDESEAVNILYKLLCVFTGKFAVSIITYPTEDVLTCGKAAKILQVHGHKRSVKCFPPLRFYNTQTSLPVAA